MSAAKTIVVHVGFANEDELHVCLWDKPSGKSISIEEVEGDVSDLTPLQAERLADALVKLANDPIVTGSRKRRAT